METNETRKCIKFNCFMNWTIIIIIIYEMFYVFGLPHASWPLFFLTPKKAFPLPKQNFVRKMIWNRIQVLNVECWISRRSTVRAFCYALWSSERWLLGNHARIKILLEMSFIERDESSLSTDWQTSPLHFERLYSRVGESHPAQNA